MTSSYMILAQTVVGADDNWDDDEDVMGASSLCRRLALWRWPASRPRRPKVSQFLQPRLPPHEAITNPRQVIVSRIGRPGSDVFDAVAKVTTVVGQGQRRVPAWNVNDHMYDRPQRMTVELANGQRIVYTDVQSATVFGGTVVHTDFVAGDFDEVVGTEVAPSVSMVREGRGVLRKGMSGGAVWTLQALLGDVDQDGDFGPQTEDSVKRFQKATPGLYESGVVGADTLEKLEARPAHLRPRPTAQTAPKTIRERQPEQVPAPVVVPQTSRTPVTFIPEPPALQARAQPVELKWKVLGAVGAGLLLVAAFLGGSVLLGRAE